MDDIRELRRQVRQLRQQVSALAVLVVFAFVAISIGAKPGPQNLTVRGLTVVDGDGQEIGSILPYKDGCRLLLTDNKGRATFAVVCGDDGRANVAISSDGGASGVKLSSSKTGFGIGLDIDAENSALAVVSDAAGDRPKITIRNKDARSIWSAP